MLEDKYEILPLLRENRASASVDTLAKLVIDGFKSEMLTKPDEILLNLVFAPNPSQKDLDDFLSKWDIEVFGGHKALMLSYFMKLHPNLQYPKYVAPRLKGLLDFYRFRNMKLISHFTKICNELKKSDIDVLIFKGGCMKHLRPEFSRIMGDIDILVHEKDYSKAGTIAQEMGYDAHFDIHSIDLHPKGSEEGIMDIHKYIIMDSDKEKNIIDDIFQRATLQKVFGISAYVPCNEDLFFISLVNMVRNLRNKTSYTGILYTLFDCKFLIDSKPDFNWDIIIQNAIKSNTQTQVCFATQFINSIVPNLLPEKIACEGFFKNEFKNYCTLLMYQRFYLWDMKQKSHKLKFKDIFKSRNNFIEYLKLKPKYFILKLWFIRKNPKMARLVMKYSEKKYGSY